jgi:hypothetical protein
MHDRVADHVQRAHRHAHNLFQLGRQLPGVPVPRDGGQWAGDVHELPGSPRVRRATYVQSARAGNAVKNNLAAATLGGVFIAIGLAAPAQADDLSLRCTN